MVRVRFIDRDGKTRVADGEAGVFVKREDAKQIVFSILDLEKPIVAKVNGHAMGLGASFALLTVVVFIADSATIGDPHVKVGLVAQQAMLAPLKRRVHGTRQCRLRSSSIEPIFIGQPRGHVLFGDVADVFGGQRFDFQLEVVLEHLLDLALPIAFLGEPRILGDLSRPFAIGFVERELDVVG